MSTVLNNVSLLPFNTFGIKANAKYFTEFGSTAALIDILKDPQWSNIKKMILGGGSNILLTHDFDGLVLKNSMLGIEIKKEDPDYFYVKASAGEQWHDFVLYCLHHQMGGVENLSLIPGSVGASPMQNIGAYGVELQEPVAPISRENKGEQGRTREKLKRSKPRAHANRWQQLVSY